MTFKTPRPRYEMPGEWDSTCLDGQAGGILSWRLQAVIGTPIVELTHRGEL